MEDTHLEIRRSTVAEVVFAHKRRQGRVGEGVGGVGAGTDVPVMAVLVQSRGKGPDVPPGVPVSEANTIHVVLVDGDAGVILVSEKSVW